MYLINSIYYKSTANTLKFKYQPPTHQNKKQGKKKKAFANIVLEIPNIQFSRKIK
jgi:hypothetical protein